MNSTFRSTCASLITQKHLTQFNTKNCGTLKYQLASQNMIELLRVLNSDQESTVRTACGDSIWFKIEQGVRQGCILSPHLFNAYAEYIMHLALDNCNSGILIGGRKINNLRYADDTILLAGSAQDLEDLIERVRTESEKFGPFLNVGKTKVMIINQQEENPILIMQEMKQLKL